MLFCFSINRDARADNPVCGDSRVTIEGQLDARFSATLEGMCEKLGLMPNIDPTARLVVSAVGSDLLLEALLADGRKTLRRVRTPEELPLTIEALLSLPPDATPSDKAADKAAKRNDADAASLDPKTREPESRSKETVRPIAAARPPGSTVPGKPISVGIELGAEVLGRASGSPLYLAVGPRIFAGVRVDRWLFALIARWDAYEIVVHGKYPKFEMNGLGAGFLIAPMLVEKGAFRFDLGLATVFLTEEQGYVPAGSEISDTNTDIRLAIVARALAGKGKLRGLFTLDTELSPLRLRRAPRIDAGLPTLPSFGAGVGAGFAWVGP